MATIDVTVTHSLGVLKARERLQDLLMSYRNQPPNPNVKLVEATWIESSSCLNFIINYSGKDIKGQAVIAPAYVRVTTDPLPFNVITATIGSFYVSSIIRKELTKALS